MDPISFAIIGAAIDVHRELGPGLLESAYEACLAHELTVRGFDIQRQVPVGVTYQGVSLGDGFRADILVGMAHLIELKTVTELNRFHRAQMLTYSRLTQRHVGLLLNFHVDRLKDGIIRVVL